MRFGIKQLHDYMIFSYIWLILDEKKLTDITVFSISVGKIYLPEIIDCFDGMEAAWNISTSQNVELVNHTLDKYHDPLNKEKPLIHKKHVKKGFSCDNAACKSFFGRIKNEMFYGKNSKGQYRKIHCHSEWINHMISYKKN